MQCTMLCHRALVVLFAVNVPIGKWTGYTVSFAFTVPFVLILFVEQNRARLDFRILLNIGCLRLIELLRVQELIILGKN